MAQLVLGFGSSHGPSIQTQPEGWAKLGEKDTQDPRFDYQSLLASAPANIKDEIRIEKQQERYAAAHAALSQIRAAIKRASPDVLVIISNPHRVWEDESKAVFGVLRAETLPVAERQEFDPNARFLPNDARPKPSIVGRPGHPSLANHLIGSLNELGFDVSCADGVREGFAIDDAFAFAYEYILDPGDSTPVVPFQLSRYLPYQATAARCYALGVALREAVESWDSDSRVAVMASGGLSHQIIDEDLDRSVIAGLEQGDVEALSQLQKERLNGAPGTPETLNWLAVAGAMAPATMSLVDYLPCYRSLAGTGHGLTFGLWT